jgi:DNA-binding beta-propeller fold protein YncE
MLWLFLFVPLIEIQVEFLFKFGEFSNPRGISISPTGEIYVADTGNNSIKKFSSTGSLLVHVSGYGWGALEFDQPYDVDARRGVAIYVADYNNHRIQRFDKNLNYIATFKGDSDDGKFFAFPRSVAVSKFDELFLIDGENVRCVKINKFNQVVKVFGGVEAGQGRLINPIQISISPQNLIVVLDENDVLIFDYYGNFLKRFGSGLLKKPTGVFADLLIFVADGKNVFMFDYDGKEVAKISFDETIRDVVYQNSILYCLTEKEVLVYKLIFKSDGN